MLRGGREAEVPAVACPCAMGLAVPGKGVRAVAGGTEILPEDKSRIIARLRAEGHRTAFVGDGFNDAAALSEADIGIALHSGADIAVKASDITLMSGGLAGVARAIRLARAIKLNMAQNLFWAFAYNSALIPLAAGVLYPFTGFTITPHFAGAAMALSSVSVVLNSLRLRSVKV